jgi:aspartate kinase
MIVLKFGGSSLATAAHLRAVVALIRRAGDGPRLVVLSAMGKTTDALFAAARAAERGDAEAAAAAAEDLFRRADAAAVELLSEPAATRETLVRMRDDVLTLLRGTALLRERTPRTTDAIVSHGERIAATLLTALLHEREVDAQHVDARLVLRTDDRFGRATPQRDTIRDLAAAHFRPVLARGAVVVTEGYIGSTATGATTTLGRGGSDWSAALIGEALGAAEVQIWTDVEGVLTADPRVVVGARPIATLSANEAAELAAFGAKVLHPSTIQPAMEARIPVTVRHTQRPDGAFTTIDPRQQAGPRGSVAALACRGPITVLTMTSRRMLAASGYLARLFAAFGELDIPVDLVATAEVSVACTVEADAPIERLVGALAGLAHVDVATERAIVAMIGDGLSRSPRLLERASRAMYPIVPELMTFGGNERNLSFVVRQHEVAAAMQRLHQEFFAAVTETAAADRAGVAP